MTTTRAIRIDQFGGPDVMRLTEIALPAPGAGEVQLRHTAIGVNFIDTYHRSGLYPLSLPAGLGSEAAGVIERVGAGVEGFEPGQRVVYTGAAPADSYRERRNLPAASLIAIPDGIEDDIAAASLLKGLTAWFLLHHSYPAQRDDWVLVHAAAGGVGQLLTQWGRSLGVRMIGVVGSDEKAAIARANGCEATLLADHEDLVDAVRALTDGRGVAAAYDSVGKDTFFRSLDCLARRGVMVSYGNASGPAPAIAPLELAKRGSLFLTRPVLFDFIAEPAERQQAVDALFSRILDGTLKVAIHQRFALADATEAHKALESRGTTGATILLP